MIGSPSEDALAAFSSHIEECSILQIRVISLSQLLVCDFILWDVPSYAPVFSLRKTENLLNHLCMLHNEWARLNRPVIFSFIELIFSRNTYFNSS